HRIDGDSVTVGHDRSNRLHDAALLAAFYARRSPTVRHRFALRPGRPGPAIAMLDSPEVAFAGIFRPGMRVDFIPLIAGIVLAVSAFLPWVIVGETVLHGFPDVAAIWVAGLGALAAVLALLSLITRRNSRHPLLIVGLVALGIMFL